MTQLNKIFFSDDWFDAFLLCVENYVKNIHDCRVSTNLRGENFPHIFVQRKVAAVPFSNKINVDISFVVRTDYEGQKQEIEIINCLKDWAQKPLSLDCANVSLLYKGEEQKVSEKKVRQASLSFQMTVRFKEKALKSEENI